MYLVKLVPCASRYLAWPKRLDGGLMTGVKVEGYDTVGPDVNIAGLLLTRSQLEIEAGEAGLSPVNAKGEHDGMSWCYILLPIIYLYVMSWCYIYFLYILRCNVLVFHMYSPMLTALQRDMVK
jgi:hypothetical protein